MDEEDTIEKQLANHQTAVNFLTKLLTDNRERIEALEGREALLEATVRDLQTRPLCKCEGVPHSLGPNF